MRALTAALGLALTLALAGCGGRGELARVGQTTVTRAQVDALLEHGREEARAEGHGFPAAGSDGERALRKEALAILVSRARIVEAARRLGLTVSDAEVGAQVPLPRHKEAIEQIYERARGALGIPEEERGHERAFLADAVRVQLTLRKVEQRLGPAHLGAWLERARRLPVEYADA